MRTPPLHHRDCEHCASWSERYRTSLLAGWGEQHHHRRRRRARWLARRAWFAMHAR